MSQSDDFSKVLHSMRGSFAVIANIVRTDSFTEGEVLDQELVGLIKRSVDRLEQSIKDVEAIVKKDVG